MIYCASECLCIVYPLEKERVLVSGWNSMLQLYIKGAIALSDMDTNNDRSHCMCMVMSVIGAKVSPN